MNTVKVQPMVIYSSWKYVLHHITFKRTYEEPIVSSYNNNNNSLKRFKYDLESEMPIPVPVSRNPKWTHKCVPHTNSGL